MTSKEDKQALENILKDYAKAWDVLSDPDKCDEYMESQKIPKHKSNYGPGKHNRQKRYKKK